MSRRALPEVEEDIPLDHGVGPTAEVVLPENVIDGRVLDKPEAAFAVPAGPMFKEAPVDAPPEDQLSHYEQIINDAFATWEAAQQRGERYLSLSAGQALREIHRSGSYDRLGYASFKDYVETHLGKPRLHAYRLMDGVPVYQALPEVLELSVRQKAVLARIAGPEAIRKVWEASKAQGSTAPDVLKQVRDELKVELISGVGTEKREKPELTLPKVRKAIRSFVDLEALQQVMVEAADPSEIEEIADQLEQAAMKLRESLGQ